MSLLRVSGRRCCVQPSLAALLASANRRVASVRPISTEGSSAVEPPAGQAGVDNQKFNIQTSRKTLKRKFKWVAKRPDLIHVSSEIVRAMSLRLPVLGLETAIYTHGFPKPNNYELALEMEETVRANGAVPATIGILNGQILVGMTKEQLKELAESAGSEKTIKVSTRDIAYCIGQLGTPLNGGTTISATVSIAWMSGIGVVATGGLGGVHKGGETSMDISADLATLGKLKVSVITSGMKSFLDTSRTLEFLETQSVFVGTFGKRGEKVDIPGFYSRDSGYPSPNIIESPEEAANIIFNGNRLMMTNGSVFFNPIPKEFEISKSEMDPIIESAVEKSKLITGRDNTPAVLNEIKEQTQGRSVAANRELVLNNARIGAKVALGLKKLEEDFLQTKIDEKRAEVKNAQALKTLEASLNPRMNTGSPSIRKIPLSPSSAGVQTQTPRREYSTTAAPPKRPTSNEGKGVAPKGGILVIGGVGIDYIGTVITGTRLQTAASNPGSIKASVGGVAKNIAATIQQLDNGSKPVRFLSVIGKDWRGLQVLQDLKELGISLEDIHIQKKLTTATYIALNSRQVSGGLAMGMADMGTIRNLPPVVINKTIDQYRPETICFDLNLNHGAMEELLKSAKKCGATVVCEPTSAAKITKLAPLLVEFGEASHQGIDILAPNELELSALHEAFVAEVKRRDSKVSTQSTYYEKLLTDHYINPFKRFLLDLYETIKPGVVVGPKQEKFTKLVQEAVALLPVVPTLLIKLGGDGVLIVRTVKHPKPSAVNGTGRSGFEVTHSITDSRQKYDTRSGKAKRSKLQFKSNLTSDDYVYADLFLALPEYDPKTEIIGVHIFWAAAEVFPKGKSVVNSNGAGDTFLGAFVHGLHGRVAPSDAYGPVVSSPWLYYQGELLRVLIAKGQQAALATLQSEESHYVAEGSKVTTSKEGIAEDMWEHAIQDFDGVRTVLELEENWVDLTDEIEGAASDSKQTPYQNRILNKELKKQQKEALSKEESTSQAQPQKKKKKQKQVTPVKLEKGED
ncbi:hypothetical protein DRE_04204 [Drechslerella stenobrocha 248]|uniref:Carbohydrate kinase PfkB domain-containing protein n=1 Tax=Drechslerella stenobrocha 248 TaxID=1043628 RepID=W7HR57_9PEZI|nr:hypothetical protein DRE_04204 [Drechslerella stenobrocha 248]